MAETQAFPVTVITGGSDGLGLALAHEFARAGHALLLVARSREGLDDAARTLGEVHGVGVHVQPADLATAEGCAAVASAAEEGELFVEFLVNNAGIGASGPFADTDSDRLMGLVDLNVRALTDLTRRFLPGMIAANRGGVLNVASLGGFLPGPYEAAYYASKAYVVSLSEALAQETAGTRVRVAALAPGPLRTAFHERMGSENDYYIRFQGMMAVEEVARIGYANFMCGQKVIVPGAFNMLSALALRVMPHPLLLPGIAWLLAHREDREDA